MISEKDIRDFKEIDCTKAKQYVRVVRYYDPNEKQYKEAMKYLDEMIEKIELLQNKAVKQVPALFKPLPGEQ